MEIKKSKKKIVEIIVNRVQTMQKKYLKTVDSSQLEEVSRRLSMLTRPFVAENLEKISQILYNLKINVSNSTLVHTTLSLMQATVILIPDIGPTKCVLVRERTAEFISRAINYIRNNRVRRLKSNRNRKKISESTDGSKYRPTKVVLANQMTEIFENTDDEIDFLDKSTFSIFARRSEMNVRCLILFQVV